MSETPEYPHLPPRDQPDAPVPPAEPAPPAAAAPAEAPPLTPLQRADAAAAAAAASAERTDTRPVAQRGDPDHDPPAPRRTIADSDPWRPYPDAPRDPRQSGEMPFLKHLDELRVVLMHSVIGAALGTMAGWLLAPRVLQDLIARTVKVAIVLTPMEAFNERFKIALILGVIVSGPYIFYRIWSFIVPGLLKRERGMVIPVAALSLALFLSGVAVAYFYVVPMVIRVLSTFLVPGMQAQFRVADVLDFFYNIALACGVICQLPLVTMGLTALGIVTPRFLLQQWRYAIVGAFLLTAIITPGDVITAQIILGFPMAALYFLSVGLSFLVVRGKRGAKREDDVSTKEVGHV